MSKLTDSIAHAVEDVIEQNGCRLVDVEIGREGKDKVLFIYIDRPDGVDLNACEQVTRAVDPIIEQMDPIADSYMLCVSSPGIDRPLKKHADYMTAIGSEVEIKLYRAIDKKKQYVGILKAYDEKEGTLALDIDGKEMIFSMGDVSLARPYIRF